MISPRRRIFQAEINGHPHSGWLGFPAAGREDKKHDSALIVAPASNRVPSTRFDAGKSIIGVSSSDL